LFLQACQPLKEYGKRPTTGLSGHAATFQLRLTFTIFSSVASSSEFTAYKGSEGGDEGMKLATLSYSRMSKQFNLSHYPCSPEQGEE
jgi:hypothetical protein